MLALMVVASNLSNDPGVVTANVSGIMIAFTLPRLLFGILAGVYVDRWDRRRTMIVSDVVRLVLTLGMIPAFMTQNFLLLLVLVFAMSSVGAFFNPAKGALIPNLVPMEQLTSANSLSQTSMMLATFVGPALAGATFAIAGNGNQWVAFAIDSLSFLISAVAIWLIRVPHAALVPALVPESDIKSRKSELAKVWEDLTVGLKALFLNRTMATLAVVFAVTMLGVGALNVLWVAFLKTNYGFSQSDLAWRLSLIDIAFSAGMVLASVASGNFFSHLTPKWFIVVGLIGAGVATVPLGYLPDFWLLIPAMFIVGLFVAPINTGSSTIMQVVVPNKQLGRVGGGIGTIVDTATLTSMSLAGALGAIIGIPAVFVISGLLCTAGGVLAWVAIPPLTLKDKIEEPESTKRYMPLDEVASVA